MSGASDGGGDLGGPAPSFDRVEYATGSGGSRCEACQGPLAGIYFQANGRVICTTCRGRIDVVDTSLPRRERVIMATIYGGGAALVGSLVWYLVARVTGMELGIIAIGIGLFVGHGVRKGSRARGGRGYQALAMVLTYLSIVTSYVPSVVTGMMEHGKKAADSQKSDGASPSGAESAKPAAEAKPDSAKDKPQMNPVVALGLLAAIVLGIAIAAPFLAGASNFMGWLIIAIALYEAWKINRRPQLTVLGPFSLAPAAGAAPSPGTAAPPAF